MSNEIIEKRRVIGVVDRPPRRPLPRLLRSMRLTFLLLTTRPFKSRPETTRGDLPPAVMRTMDDAAHIQASPRDWQRDRGREDEQALAMSEKIHFDSRPPISTEGLTQPVRREHQESGRIDEPNQMIDFPVDWAGENYSYTFDSGETAICSDICSAETPENLSDEWCSREAIIKPFTEIK